MQGISMPIQEVDYGQYTNKLIDRLNALDRFFLGFVPAPRLQDLKRCETAALFFAAKCLAPLVPESGDPGAVWLQQMRDDALRQWLSAQTADLPAGESIQTSPRYAAVHCNIRGPIVAEARRSIYLASIPHVARFGASALVPRELVAVCIPSFYTGLVPIYFELFGRATTFNERVLSAVKLLRLSEFVVLFEPVQEHPMSLHVEECRLVLSLPPAVWRSLIVAPDGRDLRGTLWNICWNAMCSELQISRLLDRPWKTAGMQEGLDGSAWFSSAIHALSRQHLKDHLAMARVGVATKLAESGWGDAFRAAEMLFGKTYVTLGPLAALDSLFAMLQGVILFAPWAAEDDVPLPVVTYAVRHSEAADASFQSGLTFRFLQHDVFKTEVIAEHRSHHLGPLQRLVQIIDDLFARAHSRYKSSRSAIVVPPPAGMPESLWRTVVSREAAIQEFSETVANVLRISELFSGHHHEGLPTLFRIVVAAPEFLKHVVRVLSRESPTLPFAEPDSGTFTTDGLIQEAASLYKAHFSIFRDDRVAGYIDPYRMPSGCEISKIVLLKEPTTEDYFHPDFRLRNTPLRYAQLSSWFPHDSTLKSVVVTTDSQGNIRVFTGGKEVLRRRRATANQAAEWVVGIDAEFPGYPQPRIDLRAAILRGLAVEPENREGFVLADDLSTVLLEIGEEPGVGALIVLLPPGVECPSSVFTSLTPSSSTMRWARPRATALVQREFLKCQAILDGAIVVRYRGQANYFIESRKFVIPLASAGQPATIAEKVLDADEIVRKLDQWIVDVEKHREWVEALRKLRVSLATMGARHRAATLLSLTHPRLTVVTVSADGPIRVFENCPADGEKFVLYPRQIL